MLIIYRIHTFLLKKKIPNYAVDLYTQNVTCHIQDNPWKCYFLKRS